MPFPNCSYCMYEAWQAFSRSSYVKALFLQDLQIWQSIKGLRECWHFIFHVPQVKNPRRVCECLRAWSSVWTEWTHEPLVNKKKYRWIINTMNYWIILTIGFLNASAWALLWTFCACVYLSIYVYNNLFIDTGRKPSILWELWKVTSVLTLLYTVR